MTNFTKSFLALLVATMCTGSMHATTGDVDANGIADIDDLNAIINCMIHRQSPTYYGGLADVTLDGIIDIDDVNMTMNVLLHRDVPPHHSAEEVYNGPDGDTYRITGRVAIISNATYGNWYLVDPTGQIYIYGTLNPDGSSSNYPLITWNIEVGDIVTVEGQKSTYNNIAELVNVNVLNVRKSPIRVLTVDPVDATVDAAGGEVKVRLTVNGSDFNTWHHDSESWLSKEVVEQDGEAMVTFKASPNDSLQRVASIAFTGHDAAGWLNQVNLTIVQKGAIVESSISGFLTTADDAITYIITAIVTSTEHGGLTLNDHSAPGVFVPIDANEMTGIKPGDIATVAIRKQGTILDSNLTILEAHVKSNISVIPMAIAEIPSLPDSDEVYYMVTGTIDEILNDKYGNLYLSDDDGNRIYVYGVYEGWGATAERTYTLSRLGIEVGDRLTVLGVKGSFRGTPELMNTSYFSHQKP